MSFFFDTNVCIGFIFRWNPWHDKAKEIFQEKVPSYWSDTVKNESIYVFNKLNREYDNFLYKLKNGIINYKKDLIKKEDLNKISSKISVGKNQAGKDIIDKNRIVSSIWEDKRWYEVGKNNLIEYLAELIINLSIHSFRGFKKCENILNLHPSSSSHFSVKNIFLKQGIHFPDWQICLDAHDLACSIQEVVFVTSDYGLINLLQPILHETKIKEIFKMDKLNIFP